MENNVQKIIMNYEKEVKKIDEKYNVAEVKKIEKIDDREIKEKIEYEKSFIQKLKDENAEINRDLIQGAENRLKENLKRKEEIDDKNRRLEENYSENVKKREEKLFDANSLKKRMVTLDSGREVTQEEKDKMDKATLRDNAIKDLNQESRVISDQLMQKSKELEEKRLEWNDFKYEYEKDENGNSTGKVTNADVVKNIHKDFDNIKKEMSELTKMQEECVKYVEQLKQERTNEDKKIFETWKDLSKQESEKNQNIQKQNNENKSIDEQEFFPPAIVQDKNLEQDETDLEIIDLDAIHDKRINTSEKILNENDKVKVLFSAKYGAYIINSGNTVKRVTSKELNNLNREILAQKLGKEKSAFDKADMSIIEILSKLDKEKGTNKLEKYVDAVTQRDKTKVEIKQFMKDNNINLSYDLRGLYDNVIDENGNKVPLYSEEDRKKMLTIANNAKSIGVAKVKKGTKVVIREMLDNIKNVITLKKLTSGKGENDSSERLTKKEKEEYSKLVNGEYMKSLDGKWKRALEEEKNLQDRIKIDNKDNHLEAKAAESQKETVDTMAKEVKDIMTGQEK